VRSSFCSVKKRRSGLCFLIIALRLRTVEDWAKPLQFQEIIIMELEGAW